MAGRNPKDDRSYVRDILHFCGAARRAIEGMTRERFESEETIQLAAQKAVENVGEAANRLTAAFKAAHDSPEWAKMIGMRHRLVHDYGDVDRDILWSVIRNELPRLVEVLSPVLDDPGNDDLGGPGSGPANAGEGGGAPRTGSLGGAKAARKPGSRAKPTSRKSGGWER